MRKLAKLSLFIILSSISLLFLSSCGEAAADDMASEEPLSIFEKNRLEKLQQLTTGRQAYTAPDTLAVGETELVEFAIIPLVLTDEDEAEADAIIAEALNVAVEDLETETIDIATEMIVRLTDETDAFKIESKTTTLDYAGRQSLSPNKPTEWLWEITPLKPGNYNLTLTVSYVVRIDGVESQTHTVSQNEIEVDVELFGATGGYILETYWLPLLVLVLVVGGTATYYTSKTLLFRKQKRALLADLAVATPEQGKGYIFVSYAHVNEKFVIPLASDLMKQGVRVWLDQREIRAGEDWMEEIQIGLAETDALMVVLSPKSVTSKYVMMEVEAAIQSGKQVFPVMYKMAPLPPALSKLHFVDFQHDYPTALETLVSNLNEAGFQNKD